MSRSVTGPPKKTNVLEEKSSMMDAIKKLGEETIVRRLEFQKRLEERARSLHNAFLSEKGLEWTISSTHPKWHPDFNLESVPDIEKAELPIKKAVPYLEALKKKSALFNTVVPKDPFLDLGPVKKPDDAPPPTPIFDKDGKQLSRAQALLERVREKQRKREALAAANPRDSPLMVKRRSILSRLRSIASSLSMHVRSNGRTVFAVPAAIAHLQLSFPNYFLSTAQWYEHIEFLVNLVPEFCSKEVLVNCTHLKTLLPQHYLLRFHRDVRIKTVSEAIEAASKESA